MAYSDYSALVINSEVILDDIGFWPSFHDGEIEELNLKLPDYLELVIRVPLSSDVDDDSAGDCRCWLRCEGIDRLDALCFNEILHLRIFEEGLLIALNINNGLYYILCKAIVVKHWERIDPDPGTAIGGDSVRLVRLEYGERSETYGPPLS